MSWKRLLFLFHRWVGIVLCAFFVLWFVSGIFMMYVEFPQLTRPERLAGEASLDFSTAQLSPAQVVGRLTRADFNTRGTPTENEVIDIDDPAAAIDATSHVRLVMVLNRPAYIVQSPGAQARLVFADNGEVLRNVTPDLAKQSVIEFATRTQITADSLTAQGLTYEGLVQTDQWTVSAALNDHRPLHRIALNDDRGTELYVSSRTAEIVRDTHTNERVLNYFAAVTHWLYPTFIRQYPDGWAWMVDILAGIGTVFAISGLWIGILRWRRNPPVGKPAVPYRGIMRWHYFTGAIFGLCLLTWLLSGLLSMNPGKLNPSRSPSKDQARVFGGSLLSRHEAIIPGSILPKDAVEAELLSYEDQPFFSVTMRSGQRRMIFAGQGSTELPNADRLIVRAAELMPTERVIEASLLNDYDDYYYTRQPERGDKPLPVVRVRFADDDKTWFHLDPLTGQVLERSTSTNRLYRWLYNGLHSWDIRWLWERRPLWDIAMITFMSGGILLSILGVIVGVRRLRR
jgi:uncharacterized iron-regulated membrane protein